MKQQLNYYLNVLLNAVTNNKHFQPKCTCFFPLNLLVFFCLFVCFKPVTMCGYGPWKLLPNSCVFRTSMSRLPLTYFLSTKCMTLWSCSSQTTSTGLYDPAGEPAAGCNVNSIYVTVLFHDNHHKKFIVIKHLKCTQMYVH